MPRGPSLASSTATVCIPPVYRYTLPDGRTHEAKSDTSSGSARGKETGRVVSLMISAHNPTDAREATNYLFDAIGILLIAPGVWLGYTALTAYSVTWMTWIMMVVMLFYLTERGHRVFISAAFDRRMEETTRSGRDGRDRSGRH